MKGKGRIMKIVVIGGTGLIGSKLVKKLRDQGHEAIAASPNSGVNTLTGEGLAEVLKGASVVVDVSNSPSFEERAAVDFFCDAPLHPPPCGESRRRRASRCFVRCRDGLPGTKQTVGWGKNDSGI